eukprot:CAMPEP_0181325762 /NCGR_PEP_ID=MMETSP1101-20121128/21114_1 /TAXON_ID=46948 /ORGANISM="Rhodomonas abbreviata, Strain Caron Lab Isolate" /LENGTH=171 /DNA_ID=CAMNT_0023434123 /DNA_START=119 /DNA_END=631 /DNA_ORIENTATION=+
MACGINFVDCSPVQFLRPPFTLVQMKTYFYSCFEPLPPGHLFKKPPLISYPAPTLKYRCCLLHRIRMSSLVPHRACSFTAMYSLIVQSSQMIREARSVELVTTRQLQDIHDPALQMLLAYTAQFNCALLASTHLTLTLCLPFLVALVTPNMPASEQVATLHMCEAHITLFA